MVLGKEATSRALPMVAEESGYFAAHGTYGGPAGLRRLVAACHLHGLACFLDVV